jgi:peptide deformylase
MSNSSHDIRTIGACSVLKLGDPRLHQACALIPDRETACRVSEELWATLDEIGKLYDFTRGTGIAAPQIGRMVRLFVATYAGVRRTFVDPLITERSSELVSIREGCLSFFDFRGMVPRHRWVRVSASDLQGQRFELLAEGNEASLYQHEIDHLDGVLYFDRLPNGKEDLILAPGMPRIP